MFSNNDILPYLYINKINTSGYIDMEVFILNFDRLNSFDFCEYLEFDTINRLFNNINDILDDLVITQIYSRKYFEDNLQDIFGIKAEDYIEYLN